MTNEDDTIARYYQLKPTDFRDLERMTVVQSPLADGYDLIVEVTIRAVKPGDMRRLLMRFVGVRNLLLSPPMGFAVQFSLIEIRSIRDNQWESINYAVPSSADNPLSLLCRDFDARIEGG